VWAPVSAVCAPKCPLDRDVTIMPSPPDTSRSRRALARTVKTKIRDSPPASGPWRSPARDGRRSRPAPAGSRPLRG
jgi:hypothetical protein